MCDCDDYQAKHPELLYDRGGRKIGADARRLLQMVEKQNAQCYYCGEFMLLRWRVNEAKLTRKQRGRLATKEHLIPVSRNGKTTPKNLRAACSFCNEQRGNEPQEAFQLKISKEGRTKLWTTFARKLLEERYRKFIRSFWMRSYAVFWLSLVQNPEFHMILAQNVLRHPVRVRTITERHLNHVPFAQLHQFILRLNTMVAADAAVDKGP